MSAFAFLFWVSLFGLVVLGACALMARIEDHYERQNTAEEWPHGRTRYH